METVVRLRVNVGGVRYVIRLQRCLVCGPAPSDALIQLPIVEQQWSLDFRSIRSRRLSTIERDRRSQPGQFYRQSVHHPASVAEANRTDFTSALRAIFEILGAGTKILEHLFAVKLP